MASAPTLTTVRLQLLQTRATTKMPSACHVCCCSLFSEGLRVVFLPSCRHYFHEDCLNESQSSCSAPDRSKSTTWRKRTCPQGQGSFGLIHSLDFDIPLTTTTTRYFSQPIDMAMKLVQKLLWTAITHNVVPLLNLLLQDFIRAETFINSRLLRIRPGSGCHSCTLPRDGTTWRRACPFQRILHLVRMPAIGR